MDTHVLVKEASLIPGLMTTRTTSAKLSLALAGRLKNYALQRFSSKGFDVFCKDAKLDIYTLDGEEAARDRTYMVRFSSPKGGFIELNGIVIDEFEFPKKDFGFSIGDY
ncbi:hypothetical protein [Comamonas thiooxydans]|uniref:hypothetical protein n=1 Tax=Comamonas thiooxydans TaxID=363952 RepID=UPI000B420305|nr:hypothetical protein [Comamonas thiooxydans]